MKSPVKNFPRAIVSGAILVLTALSMAGCNQSSQSAPNGKEGAGKEEKANAGTPRVETVVVEKKDLAQKVEMPGTVEGYETAELYAKVGGYLSEINVDIGDTIEKGQVLAELHIPEMEKELKQKQALIAQAEADVAQAEAAVAQAEANVTSVSASLDEAKTALAEKRARLNYRQTEYKRIDELIKSGSIASELLDERKYQLDAAEAAVATVNARIRTAEANLKGAQANLAKSKADLKSTRSRVDVAVANAEYVQTLMQYSSIKAPFDGQVTRRWVDPGAFIQPADGNSAAKPLLTVTRTDVVRITLDIPMNDVRLIDRGDKALLDRVNVLPGERFVGEISRFSPSLDTRSRMMRLEIDLDNSDRRLRPGYYGYATVILEQATGTPVVPASALMSEGDQRYVFTVSEGQATRRPITTNFEDGQIVGIASGVKEGEQVIRAGVGQIADGQRVTPVVVQ